MLTSLEKEKGYKTLMRKIKLDEENQDLENEIAALAGGSRFGNKFKSTDFDKKFSS